MSEPHEVATLRTRLANLECELASFKQAHDVSHSNRVMALETRLAALREKIATDLASGNHWAALRDAFERDVTGVSEEVTALIAGAGRDT